MQYQRELHASHSARGTLAHTHNIGHTTPAYTLLTEHSCSALLRSKATAQADLTARKADGGARLYLNDTGGGNRSTVQYRCPKERCTRPVSRRHEIVQRLRVAQYHTVPWLARYQYHLKQKLETHS